MLKYFTIAVLQFFLWVSCGVAFDSCNPWDMEKTVYPFSDESIDVIIPTTAKDLKVLELYRNYVF